MFTDNIEKLCLVNEEYEKYEKNYPSGSSPAKNL